MLGRIFTGRLPTTQANLDLINSRIRKVQSDMTILDNKVRAGQIDSRQAAYQRQQLIGEVDELRRVIANSRLSTPSYKTPSDIRTGKPAKKYIADSQLRITERDARLPVRSIPSNWQATELTELDVPNIPAQVAARNRWPSHWPGNHSPMIMQAIMQTGEVNGKQLIDPRSKDMNLRLDMVGSLQDMNTAIMLKARFQQLYKTMEASPAFTNGDRTLVNIVIGKINRQITFAEQEVERTRMTKPDPTKAFEKAKQKPMPNPYPGQSDTSSGDRAPPVPIDPSSGAGKDKSKVGTGQGKGTAKVIAKELVMPPTKIASDGGWNYYRVDIVDSKTRRTIRSKFYAEHPAKYGFAPSTPEGGQLFVTSQNQLDAAVNKKIADYEAAFKKMGKYIYHDNLKHGNLVAFVVPSGYKAVHVYEKQWSNNKNKYNYNYFYDGKLFLTANGQSKMSPAKIKSIIQNQFSQFMFNGQTNQYAENGHPLVFYASGGKGGFESLGGLHKPARMRKRNGSLMGFGAMQAHDRYHNMSTEQGVISRTQRQSYLTAERELSLAKKRAGARIDVTKEIKNQPVTRPWSMQVSAPTQEVEQLHIMLDSSLQSIGITQGMLTQQAHNYIAAIVNSLDSSMNPTERTEFVVEKIMSEMVNRSALLRDDVRVDVRQNGWPPVNIAPADTTSVDGLGSAFLKTKAAMGRLLG